MALKKKDKRPRQNPSPLFFSASMILVLDRLLPSRASLHPHIDKVELSNKTTMTKIVMNLKLKQVKLNLGKDKV